LIQFILPLFNQIGILHLPVNTFLVFLVPRLCRLACPAALPPIPILRRQSRQGIHSQAEPALPGNVCPGGSAAYTSLKRRQSRLVCVPRQSLGTSCGSWLEVKSKKNLNIKYK
jgi:hypothetical protein